MSQSIGNPAQVWRSLDEAGADARTDDATHSHSHDHDHPHPHPHDHSHPHPAADLTSLPVERRGFLRFLSALPAAAAAGCGFQQPAERILPYAKMPEQGASGDPLYFATTFSFSGRSCGVLAESHNGRPTKIEGNPKHPASLGSTDAFAQASVLSLYDPERSQSVRHRGEIASWEKFLEDLRAALPAGYTGAGLRILTETVTSPTTARLLRELAARYPESRRHQYEPTHGDEAFAAQQVTFGRAVQPVYNFDQADVVVSLDCDFLTSLDGGVRYARDFMKGRDLTDGRRRMNRLYMAESSVSSTGTVADHRLPLWPSGLTQLSAFIGERFGQPVSDQFVDPPPPPTSDAGAWLEAVVADLQASRGTGLVIAGDRMPSEIHQFAYRWNEALGNVGTTVRYIDPIEDVPADHGVSLAELCGDIEAGRVQILLIVGGNPVYTAPPELEFAQRLKQVPRLTAHWSPYFDETSQRCQWHVPAAHFLESWGDARTYDGTASPIQPLIAPLFGGKTADEFLFAATGSATMSGYELVRETWRAAHPDGFDAYWHAALADGVFAGTAAASISAVPSGASVDFRGIFRLTRGIRNTNIEAVFAPDPTVWDGRFYGNSWLQELPKPWTRLTWSNAALISPATAAALSIENEQIIEVVRGDDQKIKATAWLTPGHAAECVTLHLGYGREIGAAADSPLGFNAYALRTARQLSGIIWQPLVKITPTDKSRKLACTQDHPSVEGRDIVRTLPLTQYLEHGAKPHSSTPHGATEGHDSHGAHGHPTLYPDWEYKGAAWGMTIDLAKCLDCGSCVVACQAENNIPSVGETQVLNGREMHWLRIDRYFAGEPENPDVLLQPMMCQHCEHAPCEVVCPVAATTHSSEGLNEMTYNRCVGTRYCSNNCPYKVRRFNFLEFNGDLSPLEKLRPNPDVTMRSRGVMEKCTYCVQRINGARIQASIDAAHSGNPLQIADGKVVTACQAACPSQAIVFGDVNDPKSRVAHTKADPRNYGVLEELGTRPRTTYLSHVSNPNPTLAKTEPSPQPHSGEHAP